MQSTLSTTQGVQRLQRNADTQRLASRPLASRPASVLAAAPVEGLMSASRTSALVQARSGVIAQAGKLVFASFDDGSGTFYGRNSTCS